jgi:hypothetical protein
VTAPALPTVGALPRSTALAEASPDSLGELFSRDPFSYTQLDRQRIVVELRAQRARWQAAEDAGRKAPRAQKAASPSSGPIVVGDAGDDL